MTSGLRVEVVGGGIAGLTAAAALAQRGFAVRVHERADELREIGAGIYLKENSIRVLKAIGTFERLKETAERLWTGEIRDERNRVVVRREINGEEAYTTLRGTLHRLLADTARVAGAQIVTNSCVRSADADGGLVLSTGERIQADVIVGADGVGSAVRESLGLTKTWTSLPDGATRLLVPRSDGDRAGLSIENWSGACRLGVVPCSPSDVYVFLIGPEADQEAVTLPVRREFWMRKFPHMAHIVERIADDAGRHGRHSYVEVRSWTCGRVALLGDSAHAQPPNLGQGAGMSIANAWSLAEHLARERDIPAALRTWEEARRPVSELVQRWSYRYGLLGYQWPDSLYWLRMRLIAGVGRVGVTRRKWGWLWRGGVDLNNAGGGESARGKYA